MAKMVALSAPFLLAVRHDLLVEKLQCAGTSNSTAKSGPARTI
jgi:hypothetical protein